MTGPLRYSVFTKAWPNMPLPELAAYVAQLGFDGIELPVRPGFQVEPERARQDLPTAAKIMADHGLQIYSVAGPSDASSVDAYLIEACAEAGVPILRVMARVFPDERYTQAETRIQKEYDALVPLLQEHGVTLGVQNHCDAFVPNALGLRALIGKYDPKVIAAIWDAAHEAINGTRPEFALDIIWSHLCMVNFKNAFWRQTNGPEADVAAWRHYWTDGRHGLCSWPRVVQVLKERGYEGIICLTAEYTVQELVDTLIVRDRAFMRELLG